VTKITVPSDNPIKGYTKPTPEQVALVNENKVLEELCLRQIDRISLTNSVRNPAVDPRWLALARTGIQQSFMDLNRAVFQSQRIEGDLDALPLIAFLASDPDVETKNGR